MDSVMKTVSFAAGFPIVFVISSGPKRDCVKILVTVCFGVAISTVVVTKAVFVTSSGPKKDSVETAVTVLVSFAPSKHKVTVSQSLIVTVSFAPWISQVAVVVAVAVISTVLGMKQDSVHVTVSVEAAEGDDDVPLARFDEADSHVEADVDCAASFEATGLNDAGLNGVPVAPTE
jgi:hypothetical protein